jgi:hypothetical protein
MISSTPLKLKENKRMKGAIDQQTAIHSFGSKLDLACRESVKAYVLTEGGEDHLISAAIISYHIVSYPVGNAITLPTSHFNTIADLCQSRNTKKLVNYSIRIGKTPNLFKKHYYLFLLRFIISF